MTGARRKVLWISHGAIAAIEAEQVRREWTDERMAEALGIQRPHWTAVRSGHRNLPFVAVCRAFAMGVPAGKLLAMP